MLLIGLGATVVVGGAGIHYWNQRHDLIELQLQARFSELAPGLRLILGAVRLDGVHRLMLSDIELRDRETDQTLLRAGNISVGIDSRTLLDHQRVQVRSVKIDGADVLMVRHEDGRWNWQEYEFNPPSPGGSSLPQIDVRQLRVQLDLKHGNHIPSARLLLASSHLQAVPASATSLDLAGTVELAEALELKLSGTCNLTTGAWSIGGQLDDVSVDQKLFDLVQNTSPRLRSEFQRVDRQFHDLLPHLSGAAEDRNSALLNGRDATNAVQFQGSMDVEFDIGQQPADQVPVFNLLVDVRDGQVSVPGLPVRLTEMRAEFFANNQQVILRVPHSRCENARLSGRFRLSTEPGAAPPTGSFEVADFHVSPQLKNLCPPMLHRLFNHFQPDFLISGNGQLAQGRDGKWMFRDLEARVTQGRLLHYRFQYPLTDIQAKLFQVPPARTNGKIVIGVSEATGIAGGHPWKATGWWENPGPAVKSHFELDVVDFPLDGRFRAALQPNAGKVLEALNLTGKATARLYFDRPEGLGRKTRMRIDGRVDDASARFAAFPFQIEDLHGQVRFDSRNAQWDFDELQGRHDNTKIVGFGQFSGLPAPGVLELTVGAELLSLDSDLYNALPDSQQQLWQMLDPSGLCDLTAMIHWTAAPGQRPVVHFPADSPIRIYNGRIRPGPFPYDMDVEEAIVSFDPNDPRFSGVCYCDIHSFKASHDDAPIVATGWAKTDIVGNWQVHLDHLTASQLSPDDKLRSALPDSWEEILARLHRKGRVSIIDSELDFRGSREPDSGVTAAWNMNLDLHDCALNAGLDLTEVSGSLTASGTWDGMHLKNQGTIRMETTRVLDMPLTRIRGPYSIADARLVLGNEDVLQSGQPLQADREERITAQAYGGTLFVDALVDNRPGSGYVLLAEVQDASLQDFAGEHLDRAGQLQGKVAAWLALKGDGDSAEDMKGSGQLEISPAALYDLPVILKLLQAFTSFTPGSPTAFDYAMLSFDVAEKQFQFKRIDLVGESIALRGRGSVGFEGDVWLDFYSRPARLRRSSLPLGNLFSNLVGNVATQWAKVTVRGTTERPWATLDPTAQLDDSVRQFLNAFNPVPGNAPRLNVPRVLPFAGSPMTFGPFPFRR